MGTNLLRDSWTHLDPIELRIILSERIAPFGQYADRRKNPDMFYLPLAGESCRVSLRFDGSDIAAVEAGPAFDHAEWTRIADEIETAVLPGDWKVGRAYTFSSYQVHGAWRGERSGVQILPAPDDAPRAPFELAEHPFILEFPLQASALSALTGHRWLREHARFTSLLNVLLIGRTSVPPRRNRHFWGMRWDAAQPEVGYIREFFSAKLGSAVIDQLTPTSADPLPQLDPADYVLAGNDGTGLRVPADLDDLIWRYMALSRVQRKTFDRAMFWIDIASSQWATSVSASFGALVSAIEAFTGRGAVHQFECPKCAQPAQHETPGATKRFKDFLGTYAPGASLAKRRADMFALRSGIFHGSTLMRLDVDRGFGWDPPWWDEQDLARELWALTRLALHNWLRASNESFARFVDR